MHVVWIYSLIYRSAGGGSRSSNSSSSGGGGAIAVVAVAGGWACDVVFFPFDSSSFTH